MVYDLRSISQAGTSEPFELQVARGQIPGHRFMPRVAVVPEMSVNTSGTVWDVNDTPYPWSAWDTAGTVSLARASASDAGKQVILYGLDSNLNEVTEHVALTDPSGNTSTTVFKRLLSARTNGGQTNVGTVSVTKGATVVAQINAGVGETLMGVFTVPAGMTAYLCQGVMTVQASGDATGYFYYRLPGDRFVIGHTFEVAGSEYHYGFTCPLPLPAGTDIDVRADLRSNNSRLTAAYDMILVKERGPL